MRHDKPLLGWMKTVLQIAAVYNVLAGFSMLVFYHEGFKLMGVEKPDVNLPIQLVGICVGLFGVGYWLVSVNPVENRNVLLLGLLSKGLGSVLGIYYLAQGKLPWYFLPVLFFADIIYLVPFAVTYRRLRRLAGEQQEAGCHRTQSLAA